MADSQMRVRPNLALNAESKAVAERLTPRKAGVYPALRRRLVAYPESRGRLKVAGPLFRDLER
jgi:hypothetical protein